MSDDWQVGDLALCVDDAENALTRYLVQVKRGGIYTVSDLFRHPLGPVGLHFTEFNSLRLSGHNADRFRRIPPLSDEERDSFIADLREPTRAPEHARTARRPELRPPSVRLREMKASYRIEERSE